MIVAVIDTNVWVSAFLNPAGFPARLIRAGKAGNFLVVSSLPLLAELQEVLLRPRLMKIRQVTVQEVDAFVAGAAAVVRLAPVSGDLRLCRDPDELHKRGIQTITVQRFINLLRADTGEAELDV